MQHIKIPHAGEILRDDFLEPLALSQNKLALALGVPANRIHQIVNGTRKITANTDLRLCKYFSMSDGFFLRLQETYELAVAKRAMRAIIFKIKPHKLLKQKISAC